MLVMFDCDSPFQFDRIVLSTNQPIAAFRRHRVLAIKTRHRFEAYE
jgi:hypothetical protein